jgi:hypothetical protein
MKRQKAYNKTRTKKELDKNSIKIPTSSINTQLDNGIHYVRKELDNSIKANENSIKVCTSSINELDKIIDHTPTQTTSSLDNSINTIVSSIKAIQLLDKSEGPHNSELNQTLDKLDKIESITSHQHQPLRLPFEPLLRPFRIPLKSKRASTTTAPPPTTSSPHHIPPLLGLTLRPTKALLKYSKLRRALLKAQKAQKRRTRTPLPHKGI